MTTTHPRQKSVLQRKIPRIFQYIILLLVVLIIVVPIVMIVFGALKTRGEFMTRPYTLPIPPNWDNILKILGQSSFWRMLRNSLVVMLATTGIVVFVCSLAAFVFARMQFRGKGLAYQPVHIGYDVSHQRRNFAGISFTSSFGVDQSSLGGCSGASCLLALG